MTLYIYDIYICIYMKYVKCVSDSLTCTCTGMSLLSLQKVGYYRRSHSRNGFIGHHTRLFYSNSKKEGSCQRKIYMIFVSE